MRILIVEDDVNKLNAVSAFLDRYRNISYQYESSYHSGMRRLLANKYDLLLLDMSMPVYDVTAQETGGRPLALAGRDILFQLRRRKSQLKAIIVTQYEDFDGLSLSELDYDLSREFPINYLGYVYYNTTQDSWKEKLGKFLSQYQTESEENT